MKKWLLIVLAVLLCAEPAYAQNPNVLTPSPQTLTTQSSGVTDCTRNTTCAFWDIGQQRSASIQVSGTFSGTMTFEATSDGSNWNTVTLTKLADATAVTTATAAGQYSIVNSGIWLIRARATTWASGTANLTAVLGNGTIPLIPVGSEAPASATFWLATANAALPNAKVLGALGTGLVFNTTTTGTPTVVVCATAGTVLQGGAPPTCTATPAVTSISIGANASIVGSGNTGEITARNFANSSNGFFTGNRFVADSGGSFRFSSSTILTDSGGNGTLGITNTAGNAGVTLNVATDSTLKLFARDGASAANFSAAGTITFAGLASSTGVRYVCASTTGVLDGQAAACVGTDAEAIASIPGLVARINSLEAQISQFKFSPAIR